MAENKNNKNNIEVNDFNEKVEITLPKIRGNDDVTVTLNGVNYQIQRGVSVKVPKSVALILERSEKQSREAQELVDRLCGR